MRARLTPGELPGRGRQSHVAFTLYDRVLCGVSRSPPCPAPARPTAVVVSRLEAEADEMWSFVQKKANKPWVWIAMDAPSRQVMAFHVGGRSRDSAQELWAKIPLVYREQATFYTDQYDCGSRLFKAVKILDLRVSTK
jgi:IS1 transposase